MDGVRFDALSRVLGSLTDRRATARTLVGGALGVLGLAAGHDADAKKKKKCKPCGDCKTCKKGKCVLKPFLTPCGGGGVCMNDACFCPNGTHNCGFPDTFCCQNGQTCDGDNVCGSCPATTDFCDGFPPVCGATPGTCSCMTSLETGATSCVQFSPTLVACTTDAECTAELEEAAVCVDICSDCPCEEPVTACFPKRCTN